MPNVSCKKRYAYRPRSPLRRRFLKNQCFSLVFPSFITIFAAEFIIQSTNRLMKKILMMAALMSAALSAPAQSKPEPYFSFRELPNMLRWCPASPEGQGPYRDRHPRRRLQSRVHRPGVQRALRPEDLRGGDARDLGAAPRRKGHGREHQRIPEDLLQAHPPIHAFPRAHRHPAVRARPAP